MSKGLIVTRHDPLAQDLNVLKNFRSKPVEKRKPYVDARQSEVHSFVPARFLPAAPPAAQDGNRARKLREGQVEHRQEVEEDDDFFATLDLEGYGCPPVVQQTDCPFLSFASHCRTLNQLLMAHQHRCGRQEVESRKPRKPRLQCSPDKQEQERYNNVG